MNEKINRSFLARSLLAFYEIDFDWVIASGWWGHAD